MDRIKVSDISWREGEVSTLTGLVTGVPKRKPFELRFEFDGPFPAPKNCGDAFAASLIPLAMICRMNLEIDSSISPEMAWSAASYSNVWAGWIKEVSRIELSATEINGALPAGADKSGLFFTMGIDSFYSYLRLKRRYPEPLRLIFVEGFDVELGDEKRTGMIRENLREIAETTGDEVIFARCNIRELVNGIVEWGLFQHGPSLAAVGHALNAEVSTVYIASSIATGDLFPWGSHPLTDGLFSTESLQVIHHGCESTRLEKIEREIARSTLALKYLRVCYKNVESRYNCGRCEKCIRTQIELHLCGVLDACPVFEVPANDLTMFLLQKLAREGDIILPYVADFVSQHMDQVDKSCRRKLSRLLDHYHAAKDDAGIVIKQLDKLPRWPRRKFFVKR